MAHAKLCLKARPTAVQLADRLRPVDGVWPDGVELYLAAADLRAPDEIEKRIKQASVPEGFAWLIEGPVDSLDGGDFDVTREATADHEVLERLAELAERLHARAVNIHLIAPSTELARLTLDCRQKLLETALPFLARFCQLMHDAGAVPTIENMPPVLRMRRSDFAFTPIGMCAADLAFAVSHVEGLEILADTSHAGLYLNARNTAADPQYDWSEPLRQYLNELPPDPPDLLGYLQGLPTPINAQISNAQGALGEGLPYAEGDFDLDPAITWLGSTAQHIVTETLEPNNDDAVFMRDALSRMRAVLA
jgi:hypothetical protein